MPYTVLAYSYWVSFHDAYRYQVKATPINDTEYNCHIIAVELVQPIIWASYHATSRHITPLVINSLERGHTHMQARIPTIHTGSIVRNQARAGLRPARTWFKN